MYTGNKRNPNDHGPRARNLLLAATALSTAVLAMPHIALAQQAEAEDGLEEIVITGSRLIRRDFVATSPVATMDEVQIEASGNVTLEETLNEFPQLNPDNTSSSNQSGGTGVLTADLRGLGAVRTLVLVDGRRFVPASETGLVDLATIPDLLVNRVEIITGGASAVYGSDAIAGAVNFILKDDFEGVEARYHYGQSTKGDANTHKVDLAVGGNFADGRGNAVLHGSYTTRDPVFMADRDFSRVPFLANSSGALQPFGSGNIPGGLIQINSADFPDIQGVDLVNADCPGPIQGVRFGPMGEPLPFCRPTDQFNYAAVNFLLRPFERWQVSGLAHFDITDHVQVYAQAFFTKKENAFQQAPEAVAPTSFGQETGTLVIPNADTNPLFPQPLRDFFAANTDFFDADGDGVFVVRNTGRRFPEFGPRNTQILADSISMTGGLRGDLELGANNFRWDAFYQFQRSDVIVNQTGRLSRSRTTLGLDTVVVDGEVQCRIDLFNCVPVNLFGTETLTAEMADFLNVSTGREDQFDRQVAGASLAGDLFELPAGAVASAFGVEWREEKFSTLPDEIARSGDLGGVPPVINSGKFDLFEIFAELRVPILSGLPAIESLALEGAVRYSDYSTIGGVWTWKGAVDWQIVDWVRARASFNRAIRAPNLNELFEAPTGAFVGGVDPCVAANNPTDAQKQLCVQQGVPASVIDTLQVGASQGWTAFSGGNPDLDEEESDTWTIGVVLAPPQIPGLSITADYFDVSIDNAITQVSSQLLVDTCFDTLEADSAPCQSITRLSTGNIDRVNAPLLNVATRKVSGIDVQIAYNLDLPDVVALPGESASLDLRAIQTWQFDDATRQIVGEPLIECAGFFGGTCSNNSTRITPDYRGLFIAGWQSGPASLRTEVQLVGDVELHPDAFPNEVGTIGREVYVDLVGRFKIFEHLELFGGVNNVFDNSPPVIGFRAGGDSNTQVQLYDVIGRRFFLGAKATF